MDRQTVIAIILCFGIFLGWQKFYIEPRMPKHPQVATQATPTQSPTETAPSHVSVQGNTAKSRPARPSQSVTIVTGTGDAAVSDSGRIFQGWSLKDYYQGLSVDTGAIDIKTVTHQSSQGDIAFDSPALSYLSGVQGDLRKTSDGAIWSYEDQNVKMERVFSSRPGEPYLNFTLNLHFKTQAPRYTFVSLSGAKLEGKDPEEHDRQLLYWTNGSLDRQQLNGSIPLHDVLTPVKYIGVQNRYFLFSIINQSPIEPKALIQPVEPGGGRISLVYPVSGNSLSIPFKVYFGPKSLPTLRAVDPTLDNTVDFGWFTPIAYPLLAILRWFFQFVKNYGTAIILLTVLLKLVTYPLTYKSMKSMKEMARLQPQLQAMKERYKDNKEEQNKKTLEMMREHGYNPMAGCLPMIIQMPVFFALYRVLYSAIELYHAPFMFWIKDLSAPDPFYVTPVLMSVMMFGQQKISPSTATDPMQQKMMLMMPLIFGVFMLNLPSGLTLYMLVNALVSIIQQVIMNKKLNIGHAPTAAAGAR